MSAMDCLIGYDLNVNKVECIWIEVCHPKCKTLYVCCVSRALGIDLRISVYDLHQQIKTPTRITESSKSRIDLLVNNEHKITDSGVMYMGLSDHSLILCVVKSGVQSSWGRMRLQ